ncbi:MAG: long-chain fatty acid--CoA ligase [Pseudomonadota bacterium]|nr:long-chain fatty acid--CoA ligase [Pseudomonadota bacterium]
MNIGDWLFKRRLFSPDRAAILFDNRTLTYSELNQRVNRLCHAMMEKGLKTGNRVGVLSRNCPEFIEVYFACAKTGLIFVPLNFRLAPVELAYQICDSSPNFLFFDVSLSDVVKKSEAFVTAKRPIYVGWGSENESGFPLYETFIAQRPEIEPSIPEDAVTWDSPQMIMYTSGTTGTPKGALLSHKKTLFNTLNAQIYFDLYSKDTMLLTLPLFHSGGLNIMAVPTLYVGGKIVLRSRFDPEAFLKDIETEHVTQAMVVPTMLNTLLKETRPEAFDLSSLRSVVIGGEPISAELMHEAQDRGLPVRQIFGQTETSIELWVPEDMAREKAGAVGLPVFHGEIQIVNKAGEPVKAGEIGEIVVKGPIQMISYWNLPEETSKTIKDGWLHTRDLGKIDEDGFVYAVDRMGDMYISGGENVYPAEVERVLLNHPKIFEAAIVGVPDEKWGRSGHAFIHPKPDEVIDFEEMVAFLRDKVAAYKIPKSMETLKVFPKTASGKIKRRELLERITKGQLKPF